MLLQDVRMAIDANASTEEVENIFVNAVAQALPTEILSKGLMVSPKTNSRKLNPNKLNKCT